MKDIKNLPHEAGIYQILNLKNNRCYIGQSKNIYNRFNKHHIYDYKNEKSLNYNDKIYQAFRKYGLDNFKVNILEKCSIEDLDKREIYWINYFNSFHDGYNMTEGGQNWSPKIFSEETKQKRKETLLNNKSLMGENHPRAKISNEEVVEIRKRYQEGEGVKTIWEDYQSLYPSIDVFKNIVFGKTYQSIPTLSKEDIRHTNARFVKEQILDMRTKFYKEGVSISDIAREYEADFNTIKSICERKTYQHIIDDIPDLRKRKTYRLNENEVREIRKKHSEGISYSELAREYKIGKSTISRCCNRITYTNID